MHDQIDLTTTVVIVTIVVALAICGGAVWLTYRNERLGAALLVGIAAATLIYAVGMDSVQHDPDVSPIPPSQSPR